MRVLWAMAAVLVASLIAYGAWLVATPDADGGRRPFGLMVLGFVLVVTFAVWLLLSSKRSNRSRQL